MVLIFSGCVNLPEKKSDEPVDDSTITSTIKARIAADPELSGLKITVVTKRREVVLSGVAPSRELKTSLIKLALGVKGVKSVEDKIRIRKSPPLRGEAFPFLHMFSDITAQLVHTDKEP